MSYLTREDLGALAEAGRFDVPLPNATAALGQSCHVHDHRKKLRCRPLGRLELQTAYIARPEDVRRNLSAVIVSLASVEPRLSFEEAEDLADDTIEAAGEILEHSPEVRAFLAGLNAQTAPMAPPVETLPPLAREIGFAEAAG